MAVSTDHGKTFSDPLMIAPPGVNEVNFPVVTAGSEGRIARELGFPRCVHADRLPDESERCLASAAGLADGGHDTGVDLPNELSGLIPDWEWCQESWEATKNDKVPTCGTKEGPVWLPGYTINMSIGQGLSVTPIQMASAFTAEKSHPACVGL